MTEHGPSGEDSAYQSLYTELRNLLNADLGRVERRVNNLTVVAVRTPQDRIHITHLLHSADDKVVLRQVFELSPTGLLSSSVEKFGVYPRQPRIEIDLSNPVVKHRLEMYAIRSTLKAPNVSPSQQIPIPT